MFKWQLLKVKGVCLDVFTIMTYNVLAENYATRSQYGYCPSWALGWSYRKNLILKEILTNQADIVCLQVTINIL